MFAKKRRRPHTPYMQSDPCNDPLWWCVSKPYESARAIKAGQLGVLSSVACEALEEGKKNKSFKGLVICGDLNVPGESVVKASGDAADPTSTYELKPHDEYNDMISLLPEGAVDCFRSTHALGSGADLHERLLPAKHLLALAEFFHERQTPTEHAGLELHQRLS